MVSALHDWTLQLHRMPNQKQCLRAYLQGQKHACCLLAGHSVHYGHYEPYPDDLGLAKALQGL